MLKPPFLKPGDKIGIIAPSRKITADALYPCLKLFESWGLKVILGEHIYAEEHQFAGDDLQRQSDLQMMLANPEIKAIICARGGYGTVRLLEGLQYQGFYAAPKWIVGYSDITVLHSFAVNKLQCPTVHAIMPINYKSATGETPSWSALKALLFGKLPEYQIESHPLNKIGTARGHLIGGNLSVLYSLTATPYDIDTENAILFLEDLDEYLYHIDRMMMNLKLTNKLQHLKGLVVGGMSDMRDNTIPFGKTVLEIIHEHVARFGYPVMYNFPAGHVEPNLPIILGKEVEINVTETGASLKYV
jgi:muramoyltetrapeptide carboxypeptidase